MGSSRQTTTDEETATSPGGGGGGGGGGGCSDPDYLHDDSDEDPTFDIDEEMCRAASRDARKKLESRRTCSTAAGALSGSDDESSECHEMEAPELDAKDAKCFDIIENLIKNGKVESLKIYHCKVYLRKYGLRLTGNKEILLGRIKEHLEVKDDGGEKKYPISSFVINCQGDACTGDVVMFEQNVYEMYSIASRSATGPPCGKRTVAGRIVKESYGAEKQQHTFTIEVLWCKGVKPLPPLHPLLIKGRNLYRLKTMRQKWDDEERRIEVLREKHTRGFLARSSRETRILQKEMRKMRITKRMNERGKQTAQKAPHQARPLQSTVSEQGKGILHQQQHHMPAEEVQDRKFVNRTNDSSRVRPNTSKETIVQYHHRQPQYHQSVNGARRGNLSNENSYPQNSFVMNPWPFQQLQYYSHQYHRCEAEDKHIERGSFSDVHMFHPQHFHFPSPWSFQFQPAPSSQKNFQMQRQPHGQHGGRRHNNRTMTREHFR